MIFKMCFDKCNGNILHTSECIIYRASMKCIENSERLREFLFIISKVFRTGHFSFKKCYTFNKNYYRHDNGMKSSTL